MENTKSTSTSSRIEPDPSVSEDAMRSIPQEAQHRPGSVTSLRDLFGPEIDRYTRADAIADGVLVQAPPSMSGEAGIRVPAALTRAVWVDCVEWHEADSRRQTPQDVDGRLWDVLFMTAYAARRHRGRATFPVELYRVPRGGRARAARKVELKGTIHRGDEGEVVLTISQPDED
ncbi:DUF6573 family protein [Streptomyces sp. NPDC001493]